MAGPLTLFRLRPLLGIFERLLEFGIGNQILAFHRRGIGQFQDSRRRAGVRILALRF